LGGSGLPARRLKIRPERLHLVNHRVSAQAELAEHLGDQQVHLAAGRGKALAFDDKGQRLLA